MILLCVFYEIKILAYIQHIQMKILKIFCVSKKVILIEIFKFGQKLFLRLEFLKYKGLGFCVLTFICFKLRSTFKHFHYLLLIKNHMQSYHQYVTCHILLKVFFFFFTAIIFTTFFIYQISFKYILIATIIIIRKLANVFFINKQPHILFQELQDQFLVCYYVT